MNRKSRTVSVKDEGFSEMVVRTKQTWHFPPSTLRCHILKLNHATRCCRLSCVPSPKTVPLRSLLDF